MKISSWLLGIPLIVSWVASSTAAEVLPERPFFEKTAVNIANTTLCQYDSYGLQNLFLAIKNTSGSPQPVTVESYRHTNDGARTLLNTEVYQLTTERGSDDLLLPFGTMLHRGTVGDVVVKGAGPLEIYWETGRHRSGVLIEVKRIACTSWANRPEGYSVLMDEPFLPEFSCEQLDSALKHAVEWVNEQFVNLEVILAPGRFMLLFNRDTVKEIIANHLKALDRILKEMERRTPECHASTENLENVDKIMSSVPKVLSVFPDPRAQPETSDSEAPPVLSEGSVEPRTTAYENVLINDTPMSDEET